MDEQDLAVDFLSNRVISVAFFTIFHDKIKLTNTY